ncbi:hypothetical protein MHY_02180 [Megamonas hypermegale ART12/1]|uniref:hypothetical protein n=1 Tax=Megamonas sp. TaxID=2049033 RepID=UPI0001CD86CD|nr:hypothetical protein [Megamonas sp.]MBS5781235.1 hypothetical protein [Megamonas sp.]CBL05399.1 hypothetical protein MHY_02180 [Megamonas hypermegale ART12/1]
MLNFEIRYTKALVILCILAVIFIGLSFVLPIEYSYENHFLENLEVVILFLGIVICIGKIRDFILYDSIKFYVASIIIYILMIGRELSWGRVFYPIGIDKNGEQIFVKVHELWYGSVVYPIVGILILIALILLVVYFYQSRRQGICWYIPLGEFLFFIVTSILGQCVFDRGLVQFGNYNQLLEESCEIIAYIALICCTYDISFKRRYIHIRYFSIR